MGMGYPGVSGSSTASLALCVRSMADSESICGISHTMPTFGWLTRKASDKRAAANLMAATAVFSST